MKFKSKIKYWTVKAGKIMLYIGKKYLNFKNNKNKKNYDRLLRIVIIMALKFNLRIIINETPDHVIIDTKHLEDSTYENYLNNKIKCSSRLYRNCTKAEKNGIEYSEGECHFYYSERIGSSITISGNSYDNHNGN